MKSTRSILLLAVAGLGGVCGLTLPEKIAAARGANTAVDRVKVLEDSDFVFDFLNPPTPPTTGAGGSTVSANKANFPGLIGNGMAMTIGLIGPCGYNTPHTHPRATEINFAVNGSMKAGMLAENGARYVFNDVHPGSVVVFPKGSIHFTMNNDCKPMMFVAAFNAEDPGVLQVAQRFFGLTPSFVAASLGDLGVEEVAELEAKIPNNIALGIDECLNRCGIPRGQQSTTQRQPRLPSNQLPDGFEGPPPPSSAAPPQATGPSKLASTTGAAAADAGGDPSSPLNFASNAKLASDTPSDIQSSQPPGRVSIVLWVFIGGLSFVALVIGVYVLWSCVLLRRKKSKGFRKVSNEGMPTGRIPTLPQSRAGDDETLYDSEAAKEAGLPERRTS